MVAEVQVVVLRQVELSSLGFCVSTNYARSKNEHCKSWRLAHVSMRLYFAAFAEMKDALTH